MKGGKHWIDFADRDLEAAKSLLENEYLANVVLFHCQQCIEKCLKAILEENNIEVPKIHSVVRLFGIITENRGSCCFISSREGFARTGQALVHPGGLKFNLGDHKGAWV